MGLDWGAMSELPPGFVDPPRDCSLMPFWFWNDALDADELRRQIDDFAAHGVYGFVIHPRVGLPRELGWMSEKLLGFYRIAIEHAAAREMTVILYDEGMYPSGSASGQVVAEDPAYACRGLVKQELEPGDEPVVAAGEHLVAVLDRPDGGRRAVIDAPIGSTIRGLHYTDDVDQPRRADRREPPEDSPPAADLLNPDAVACFIRLVHERFHAEFGEHFGRTIRAIFTDEPALLGRGAPADARPGTTGIVEQVSDWLGYDFTPHLPALWDDDAPDARRFRADYHRAVKHRLEQTYYRQLFDWCERHGVALTGHPAGSDEIGPQRWFHWPGQDVVWRMIEPGRPTMLEGPDATMAKCSSSAMIHHRRRRNANEYAGAYGRDLTFAEFEFLRDWLTVRGVNLLIPHAFYYSLRGPRVDERPPDVGPHSDWWDRFGAYADAARRLCWLNCDATHVCEVAVLGLGDFLPWDAAAVLQQHQVDFNYLDARHLEREAITAHDGIYLAGMRYRALVLDAVGAPAKARPALVKAASFGQVIGWRPPPRMPLPPQTRVAADEAELLALLDERIAPDLRCQPATPTLRYRHVVKDGEHWYLLFNEGSDPIDTALTLGAAGVRYGVDPERGEQRKLGRTVRLLLPGYRMGLLRVAPEEKG